VEKTGAIAYGLAGSHDREASHWARGSEVSSTAPVTLISRASATRWESAQTLPRSSPICAL